MLPTTETAPIGYAGLVRLTAAQCDKTASMLDAWTRTLIMQARDDADVETRDNARCLLANRGIVWQESVARREP